jgi:enolase-phosphatase E1
VYDDVEPAFERWLKSDKNIYIYSSGSVPAQVLLFSYSDYGNMTKVIHIKSLNK